MTARLIPHHLLHAQIRVSDFDQFVAFYRDAHGVRELRWEDHPDRQFTLAIITH